MDFESLWLPASKGNAGRFDGIIIINGGVARRPRIANGRKVQSMFLCVLRVREHALKYTQ